MLNRDSANFVEKTHAAQTDSNPTPSQISWTPPFGNPFRDALAGLVADHQLDLGCSLLHGAFEVRYPSPGDLDLAVVGGSRSLVQFVMRLLKQLHSPATASAIDYDAYLARFQADGGATR